MSALGDLGARMDRATAATRNLADGLLSAAAEIRRGAETASRLQEDMAGLLSQLAAVVDRCRRYRVGH